VTLRTLCSWRIAPDCTPVIHEGDVPEDWAASHGICEKCAAMLNEQDTRLSGVMTDASNSADGGAAPEEAKPGGRE
jgi:hypothetical protein